jgi:glycerophosphoryl diester phosphodiesterase
MLAAVSGSKAQIRAGFPAHKYPIIVIAHRGDHTTVPENTTAAYEHAIAVGADYVEVDLRTTSDGHLVIMHDETVDRMTNGTGKVKDLSFKIIRSLKVSDKNRPGSASFRVPTFEEVLKTCKGKINIYLDFKDADVTAVHELIKSSGMANHVAVYLNAKSHYTDWKRVAPQIPLISTVLADTKNADEVNKFLQEYSISAIDGSPGDYDKSMMSLIQGANVKIWLDVQDKNENAAYWSAILETKIDGMQTDHPGDLIKFLKEKGLH